MPGEVIDFRTKQVVVPASSGQPEPGPPLTIHDICDQVPEVKYWLDAMDCSTDAQEFVDALRKVRTLMRDWPDP